MEIIKRMILWKQREEKEEQEIGKGKCETEGN